MAFVFSPDAGKLEWYRSGTATSLLGAVGRDDDLGVVYLYQVGIDPLPSGDLEFYFHLIQRHPASSVDVPLWSGLETAKLIDRQGRAAIMAQILVGARLLIEATMPKSVIRFTHDANPPAKSMLKHKAINAVFADLGYVVTPLPYMLSKHSWRAERP